MLPPAVPGAETEIRLLAVSLAKGFRVKFAYVVEHGALQVKAEAVPGVQVEDRFRRVEPAASDRRDRESGRHLVLSAVRDGGEAGVVGDGGRGPDAGIGVGREAERIAPSRSDDGVVVEQNHVAAGGSAHAVVAGAGEAEVFVEAFDPHAAGMLRGEAEQRGTDARVVATVLDEEQKDVGRRVFKERRDERRQQFGVVVDRNDDRQRRLRRRLRAEAPSDGLRPQVRAQFAPKAAERLRVRLPSGKEAGVQEQGVLARGDRVGRKGGAGRGEATPFAPAVRAVVQ